MHIFSFVSGGLLTAFTNLSIDSASFEDTQRNVIGSLELPITTKISSCALSTELHFASFRMITESVSLTNTDQSINLLVFTNCTMYIYWTNKTLISQRAGTASEQIEEFASNQQVLLRAEALAAEFRVHAWGDIVYNDWHFTEDNARHWSFFFL